MQVSENSLENQYYRVKLNSDGDVASIFDKSVGKELLSAPARLAISYDNPSQWPAWNMDWDQEQAPPKAYRKWRGAYARGGERAARVALEISRETAGSKFVADRSGCRREMPGREWSLRMRLIGTPKNRI